MKHEFDERQQQIRAKVFRHGFTIAIVLLLLDAFLASMGIFWAPPFFRNIIMVTLITTPVGVEFIFRGVFFTKQSERITYTAGFGGVSIFLLVMSLKHIAEGAEITENGGLSEFGCGFVIALLFFVNAGCGLVQLLRERKADRE